MLSDAVTRYLEQELRAERRLKESTIDEARARLNPLIRLAPDLIGDVQNQHIRQRLAQLPSIASQKATLARMTDFFNFAVEVKLVRSNPCEGIVIKAKAKRGKVTLTRTESRALDACLWAELDANGPDAQISAALILLLYLGLRRAELLRLQVRDIDTFAGQSVISVEREAKSTQGFRDMELPQKVSNLLMRLAHGKSLTDWIWPSPSSASGHRGNTWLLKGCKRMCAKAGVMGVCPQGLRSTHGKLARKAGMTAHAVQAQLGHEDARTTVQSYIGEDVEAQERSRRARAVLGGA